MDQILARCKENKSQHMVAFLARMADCWDGMPDSFVPFWNHWSKDPTFDKNGQPFLKIVAPTDQEREIITALLRNPEDRWGPSCSSINNYWIRVQVGLEPKLEAQKLEAQKLEAQKLEAQKLEASKTETKTEIKESSSETKATEKFVLPVLYNSTYGGYGLNRKMLDLLNKAGVYECMGFERSEQERGPKTQEEITKQEKDESFGFFAGSYDLSHKLPRHHFLLTSAMAILGSARSSMITALATDFVPFRCADFYRIHEYDGAESVIAEPARAIAFKVFELVKGRSLVSDSSDLQSLQSLINELEYYPSQSEDED
jgi:hypothetical protein